MRAPLTAAGSKLTFRVFLVCWWALRRLGALLRWTLRRKSNLTACWDILSWNWSKSWQRPVRLRFLWFSCTETESGGQDRGPT